MQTISNFLYIIILLILAGIAIASLTGDNGLFARANQARQNTLDAQNKENATLEGYEDKIDEIIGGAEIIGVDTEVTNPEAAMPAGATVIQGNADEGIVIRDENENEWVWVKVPKSIYDNEEYYIDGATKPLNSEDYTNIEKIMQGYSSAYRDSNYSDTFYSTAQHGFADATVYNTAKNNMLKNVYENGGFWIGRYEVGIENNYRNYGDDTQSEHPIAEIPVIKANAYPYNYVTCKQAQTLSQQLSTGGKTSSLMFGIQWDLTCKFLETKGGLTQEQIKTDSKEWGNYSNSSIILSQGKSNISPSSSSSQWLDITQGPKNGTMLLTTGTSEDTNKMNLYDFAGNVWEWTLEKSPYTSTPCAFRGGSYYSNGSNYPASDRGSNNASYSSNSIGFRPVLY